MNINLKTIEELKPCRDRLDNFVEHYAGFNGSMKQFLNLKNITHTDKLWVFFRLIPAKDATLVAAAMAEKVLYVFEKERPNDKRPRLAIEAARRGEPNAALAAADAAYYAADAAYYAADAAYYAAYAAAYAADAAYYAADAAYYAAYAAAYAARAAAAAARAAYYALQAAPNQENVQLNIMKEYKEGK